MENSELIEEFKKLDTTSLIRTFADLYATKEAKEAELKEINKRFDALRLEVLPGRFEDEGLDNMTVTGVGRVSITSDMYARMADKDIAFSWMRDNGFSSLISETVNPSTLKAFVKEQILNGVPLPEQAFKVTPFSRAALTRARG